MEKDRERECDYMGGEQEVKRAEEEEEEEKEEAWVKRTWSIERYFVTCFPNTAMEINNSVFHRRLLFITLFPGRLWNSRYERWNIRSITSQCNYGICARNCLRRRWPTFIWKTQNALSRLIYFVSYRSQSHTPHEPRRWRCLLSLSLPPYSPPNHLRLQ